MLKLHNLFKTYQTEEVETVALNGVNVEIDQGDFVAVMGPSGCGKSTLLNIIGLLDNPTDGDYFFFDENVAKYSEAQRAGIRKKNIGFIFQSFNLIDELNVSENIELALLYHDMPGAERKRRVSDVMDRIGIAHRAKHMPGQLSGGQQTARRCGPRCSRRSTADSCRRTDRQSGFGAWAGSDGNVAQTECRGHDDRHGHALSSARGLRAPYREPVRRACRNRRDAGSVANTLHVQVEIRCSGTT